MGRAGEEDQLKGSIAMLTTSTHVYRHILVEVEERVATVTMNRPEKRNALSVEHMTELIGALREIGEPIE